MNVVDSSAWLEYFADGPGASSFAAVIQDTGRLLVPSIILLEVYKRSYQQRGKMAADEAAALLNQGTIIDLDSLLAIAAAKLGHELKLPLADSIIYATVRLHEATLWTQDAHFESLEGVRYFPRQSP